MMPTARFLHLAAAVCGLALVLALGPGTTPTAWADETDDAVAKLKEYAKDGEEGKCIAVMVELESNYDERVNDALRDLIKSKYEKIATTAIRRLASRKDKGLQKYLKKKIGDKKLAKKDPALYIAYLEAAGEYRDPKLLSALEDVVKKYKGTNPDFSRPAITSYGTVRDKEVVDQMVKWLEEVDTLGGGGQGGSGKGLSTETRDNYGKAKGALVKALLELTGQEIGDAKTWRSWWDKNRKRFEFPDPDAPVVDPATLKEWTDTAYGYTVKLPDNGEFWVFAKPDQENIRLRLMNKDDQMENVRGEFMIHNTSSNTPKTLGELVKWYTDTELPGRYANMSKGPDVEERKIGGKEWTIITTKGDCGGRFKGWGSAESRIYLHQIDHIILRIEGITRLGAEDYMKDGLWNALEGLAWD